MNLISNQGYRYCIGVLTFKKSKFVRFDCFSWGLICERYGAFIDMKCPIKNFSLPNYLNGIPDECGKGGSLEQKYEYFFVYKNIQPEPNLEQKKCN